MQISDQLKGAKTPRAPFGATAGKAPQTLSNASKPDNAQNNAAPAPYVFKAQPKDATLREAPLPLNKLKERRVAKERKYKLAAHKAALREPQRRPGHIANLECVPPKPAPPPATVPAPFSLTTEMRIKEQKLAAQRLEEAASKSSAVFKARAMPDFWGTSPTAPKHKKPLAKPKTATKAVSPKLQTSKRRRLGDGLAK
ncbi:hypothetical protein PLESTB_001337400 [Pleodorina starrii]|uniref:TPX2 C-terminal domain-containing protein n=1 Tax=Pleodorina starrii TaxID=330485 RepID=A0A9W6F781_9CHLO|nr:hypothetical protein PLESTM_001461600 [Pleodorina starrii]GLC58246.1 hypothetical protein PLESTB_001337400 [Pleodorina starrii]